MPCTVVVGAQWGDEGKGKIVDALSAEADVVARYQGGPNAGHSIVVDGGTVVLHLVPSGVMHPDPRCLIGNGVVVDLARLREEVGGLEARRLEVRSRLGLSPPPISSSPTIAPRRRPPSAVRGRLEPPGAGSDSPTATRPRAPASGSPISTIASCSSSASTGTCRASGSSTPRPRSSGQ